MEAMTLGDLAIDVALIVSCALILAVFGIETRGKSCEEMAVEKAAV